MSANNRIDCFAYFIKQNFCAMQMQRQQQQQKTHKTKAKCAAHRYQQHEYSLDTQSTHSRIDPLSVDCKTKLSL